MAESYWMLDGEVDNNRKIKGINTTVSSREIKTMAGVQQLMRESECGRRILKLDVPITRLTNGKVRPLLTNEGWQRRSVSKSLITWPSSPPLEQCKSCHVNISTQPKPINKQFVTKRLLQREVAKQQVLDFYEGKYDLETICKALKEKKPRKTREEPDSEPESESTSPESESETEPETESESTEPPTEPDPPKSPPPHALKNVPSLPDIPRTPNAYRIPKERHRNGFLPSRQILEQRYRKHQIINSDKSRPIAEEAEERFASS